jgi:hypothetical protein
MNSGAIREGDPSSGALIAAVVSMPRNMAGKIKNRL